MVIVYNLCTADLPTEENIEDSADDTVLITRYKKGVEGAVAILQNRPDAVLQWGAQSWKAPMNPAHIKKDISILNMS